MLKNACGMVTLQWLAALAKGGIEIFDPQGAGVIGNTQVETYREPPLLVETTLGSCGQRL